MERRLAAILAADVVGYSKLMGADSDSALDALRQLRGKLFDPVVDRHRGNVVKRLGDGWIVEFPSISDAVACAIDIQNALTDHDIIKLRVGIHTGEVVFEADDVFGEGVNVAARLEALANPGEVLISDTAHSSLDGKTNKQFTGGENQQLKNIDRPVRVWRWPMADASTPMPDSQGPEVPDRPSIAVLPFDNMSGDPEQEYFSDGISEDAITDLSKVSALFVVARNSSFCYKGQAVNIPQIAGELGVRYVVEGSVRKAGNRVRITAQLIDAKTGGHVWADRYDRELDDIFSVQDEITSNIVNALQLILLPGEAESIAQAPTTDFQAYDFYLKGRQCTKFERKAKFNEAREWFERAIERDPNYALAYCGLADCGLELFWWAGDKKNLEGVFDAVNKALELAPNLAEAHSSMGLALALTGDRQRAEQQYAKAIELDPNLFEAHFYRAQNCVEEGDLLKACEHYQEAWRVSPRDPESPSILLGIYRKLGRKDELISTARRVLDIGLRKLELEPNNTRTLLSCALIFVHLDRHEDAEEMVERAIKIDPSDKIAYYNIACVYALMGRNEKALDMLEESTLGDGTMVDYARNDGDFDSLRDHPRFLALIGQQANRPTFPDS